jgi:predicted metal-binding membrane protein
MLLASLALPAARAVPPTWPGQVIPLPPRPRTAFCKSIPRPGKTAADQGADKLTIQFLSSALRHDRAIVLGSLAVAIVLAWAYLLIGAGIEMETMDMGGGRMMAMPPQWTLGYGLVVFLMWAAMMVAMMLPSAAPVTLLVASITRKRREAGSAVGLSTAPFVFGYLAVWLAFAAMATLLQWRLDAAELLSETMALANTLVAGGVLVVAGIYQWTPLKQACLRHCRSPLGFILHHWRDGAQGAFASGARHGGFCLGCCWMLMVLLFVGGIMNIAWIAGIALIVLIEKTLPWGGRMGRATGAVLVVWGAVTLALAR